MSKVIEIVQKYISPKWKTSGVNIGIKCPFHKDGNERRESFYINVETGLFYCHTCKVSGTISRLLNDLGISKHIIDIETEDIRKLEYENKKNRAIASELSFRVNPYKANPVLSETVLLNFKCDFNPLPQFEDKWIKYMEIGFDKYLNRIIYPIRDIYGSLAGVSGGRVNPEDEPKYLIYRGGYSDPFGRWVPSNYGLWFDSEYPNYQFKKTNTLWNYDRVYARMFHNTEDKDLFIVEGFKACISRVQNGYSNTVALMGSSVGEKQFNLLTRLNCSITLFLDNDEAGIKGTKLLALSLYRTNKIYIVKYPPNKNQPDSFNKEELKAAIEGRELLTLNQVIQFRNDLKIANNH